MPRFAELQRLGVITSNEKKPCDITGRNCMVWDVTDRLPIQPEKNKTKGQIIKELQEKNSWLEVQIRDLKQKIESLQRGELF